VPELLLVQDVPLSDEVSIPPLDCTATKILLPKVTLRITDDCPVFLVVHEDPFEEVRMGESAILLS